MDNQGPPPTIETNTEDQKTETKKSISDKNEIIVEEPKETKEKNEIITEEKKEKNEINIEKPKEEISAKNETITENSKKEKKKKKNRLEMDGFEKFMDQYPENLSGIFEFDFYGDGLKPDCIFWRDGRKYYVFFNLDELRNKLDEKWRYIFEKYPKNLEDLKEPLEKYRLEYKGVEYKENLGFFGIIAFRMKFMIGEEYRNEDIKKRAIALAFLLCQIDYRKKEEYITIGMIDSIDLNIYFYSFPIFDTIKNEIGEINIKTNNFEQKRESLNILCETYNTLNEKIDNEFSDNDKKILKSYLTNEANKKLIMIEDNSPPEDSEEYEKMKSFRNKLNLIISLNIDREVNKSFFFDDDMFKFKIIKDIKLEKFILLNSIHMKKFYDHLVENFKNLRDLLLQLDDSDIEVDIEKKMDFIRKYMNKVQDLAALKGKISKEINSKKAKMREQGIELIKSFYDYFSSQKLLNSENITKVAKQANISYEQVLNANIEKQLLEKTEEIIDYKADETIKLIKEYDLMEKLKFINDPRFNATAINGIMISRKINNPKNHLTDLYSVYII